MYPILIAIEHMKSGLKFFTYNISKVSNVLDFGASVSMLLGTILSQGGEIDGEVREGLGLKTECSQTQLHPPKNA